MIRAGKQIAASALLLIVFCFVCRLTFFRDYNAYVLLNPVQETEFRRDGVYVTIEQPGIVSSREPVIRNGYLRVPIHAEQ